MKVKSFFRMSVLSAFYILVFFGTLLNANAQCPTIPTQPTPICDASGYTFNDLNTYAVDQGNGIVWYDLSTGGSAFNSNELVEEGIYYVDDNSGSCGTRASITIDFVVDSTVQNLDGIYCSNENPTIQTYIDEVLQPNIPVGGSVEVYTDLALTTLANSTDPIPNGATNYFIVFIDLSGCESQIQGGSTAVFNAPEDPNPANPQEFCSNTNPTVGDLDPGTTTTFNWYLSLDVNGDGIPPSLNATTPLVNSLTYYVQVEDFFCSSNAIPVVVSITDPFEPGSSASLDFCSDSIPTNDFNLFDELGNPKDTVGTWDGPLATSGGHLGTVNISTLTTPGVYTFTYTVPANGACPEASSSVTITVYEIFTSGTPSALNPATFCEAGLPSNFDLTSLLDNEDPNGQWTQGTTSADPIVASPIDLTAFTPGNYNFTYTQNILPNPCPEESTTVQVIVLQDPNAGIAVNAIFCENDLVANSPYDLFNTLDGSQDNNSGVWTDSNAVVLTNPIDITILTVAGSPYQFTYTIDNGTCSDFENTTITIEPAPESGIPISVFPEFCEGAAPASFDLFDLLNGEDQTGTWYIGTDNTGSTTVNPIDASVLTPGTYTYTFDVDAIGSCDDELVTVQITINPLPNTGTPTPVTFCENDLAANSPLDLFGQLAGNDAGGTWSDDDASGALTGNTVDLTLLTIGVYNFTYTITDANGCTNSSTVTITIEDAPESGTPVATFPEFCEGAAPASFDLFDLLNGEDQTGTWFIGTDNTGTATTNPIDASVLTPGTYNYTFDVDAIGSCDDELVTVQITINPLPNTGTPTPAIFCENDLAANSPLDLFGQLAGNDAGGTWSDDNTTGALSGNNVDLTLLTIGVYNFTYTIIDVNGCTNSSTVTITVEDAPESGTPVATFPVFCEGAAPASFDLFDLLNGEDQTGTWFIGIDNTGTAIANPIDASVLTPGTYNYTFDVDAIGSCDDALVTVQITINPIPNTGIPTPAIFCENDLAANSPLDLFGQLTGNDAGGTWSDDDTSGALSGSSVDLTLLSIGVYNFTYTITDTSGCTNSSTVTITVEDAPIAGTVNATPEFCVAEITTGQSINLFDYLDNEDQPGVWSDNTPSNQLVGSVLTIDGLATGSYTFTYDVDAIGTCDDPNMPTVTIIINDTPAPTAAATQDFCDAATVGDLAATGNAILWYDDAVGGTALDAATSLINGETYYATQTDATTGCESSTRVEITVTIVTLPNSGGVATSPIIVCNNTTVDLNTGLDGTQDATGVWTDGSGTVIANPTAYDVTGFTPGDYSFTYSVSAAPCTDATTTITVSVQQPLSSGTSNGDLTFCSTDSTSDLFSNLTGEDTGGDWIFNGNSVSSTFDPLTGESGTYTYFIVNACGNSSTSFDITVSQAPNAGTDGTFTICAANVDATNNMLDLLTVLNDTPDASGTFTNNNGAIGFSGTNLDLSLVTPGTYNFTYLVAATAPCTVNVTAIATVTVNDTPAVTVINATPAFCLVDSPTVADLDASVSGTTIIWYAEENDTTPLASTDALEDGEDYFATQNDATNGCESSTKIQVDVSVNDAPTPTLIDVNLELCINDAPTIAELTANISEYNASSNNVIWYDASTNGNVISSTTALELNTTYYAVLIDPVSGCESSVRLEVSPDLTGCGLLIIPDGFSPNDDGVNDTFDMDNLDILYPNFEIEIYNRYGNVVYKGNASTPRFDGTSNQSRLISKGDLPVGVYYYIFNFNDGVNKPQQGNLYLSR